MQHHHIAPAVINKHAWLTSCIVLVSLSVCAAVLSFNHLLLPAYSNKEKLRRYLDLALENSQGFGLI